MKTVLLIDDEVLFAKSVARRLNKERMVVEVAGTLTEARQKLQKYTPDIVLLDVRLPDGNGLDLLTELRTTQGDAQAQLPIIVMTAYGEIDDAVAAMKLGATDYLKKPVDLDELVLTIAKVHSSFQIRQQLHYSQTREQYSADHPPMLGTSPAIQSIRQQIEKIARLVTQNATHTPILLLRGETGTGKDVTARYYHQVGNWGQHPFVHVDCASLPKDLMESELFGYEQGAFTSAYKAKAGLIEIAEQGTLFLDEVGELSLSLQAKLLNVLERRMVRRLGATKERPVHAHFVAATNRDLSRMVAEGEFRSDLYYRLNMLELILPPLRERPQDIPILAAHFIEQAARRYGLTPPHLSDLATAALHRYHWPGNIRELQHVLERAVMLCTQGVINDTDLQLQPSTHTAPASTATTQYIDSKLETMTLEQVEKYLIKQALKRSNGNVSRAARELGLTRMAMRYRMEKYQLT